jgi:S-DNA-T family DNA segregation ATPase FtsK/SpoIIIE
MGIEVPNRKARVVAIREVAEGAVWQRACEHAALPLLLGKDVAGDDLVVDLARMPHLLIAGATGSGKSACINSILAGLLMARKPEEMKLLLVDPKMVEFMPYAELPHLVVPVITEPKKVGVSLQWAISEMNRRLKLFSRVGVRNIADFNVRDRAVQATFLDGEEVSPEPVPERLPYIVIVIDEMADLMLVAQAEIENRIARLAQKSRAAGIHMILATQRPSVNVITGTIKANFPGRIAFQVAQKVDSRTILDASGADALIGRGDMLFLNPQGSSLVRAQGSWVADAEVQKLVAFLKAQGKPVYEATIKDRLDKVAASEPGDEFDEDGGDGEGGEAGADGADEQLIKQALVIIRETRRATTSSLQRRLRIGYNRAARLMDELEQRGYIGPANGNDPREILVDLEGEMPDSEDK